MITWCVKSRFRIWCILLSLLVFQMSYFYYNTIVVLSLLKSCRKMIFPPPASPHHVLLPIVVSIISVPVLVISVFLFVRWVSTTLFDLFWRIFCDQNSIMMKSHIKIHLRWLHGGNSCSLNPLLAPQWVISCHSPSPSHINVFNGFGIFIGPKVRSLPCPVRQSLSKSVLFVETWLMWPWRVKML